MVRCLLTVTLVFSLTVLAEAANPGPSRNLPSVRQDTKDIQKDIREVQAKIDRITEYLIKAKLVSKADLDYAQKEIVNKLSNSPAMPTSGMDVKSLRDDLRSIQKEIAEQTRKMEAVQARLDKLTLAPARDVPVPAPVLVVLDASSPALATDHENVRKALLRALDESIRQWPERPSGLLVARGNDLTRPLRWSRHAPDEIAELQSRVATLAPDNRSVEVAWEYVCKESVGNALFLNQPRKRIVYVTTSPAKETRFDAASVGQAAISKGVEVWVVHLVSRVDEQPSRDLATLANETGGAYLVIPSLREASPRQKAAQARLERCFFEALDVSGAGAATGK